MMLMVLFVAPRLADQGQRRRHQDRYRIDERADLHHEDQLHQHHGHA